MAEITSQADEWSGVSAAWDAEVDEVDEDTAAVTTALLHQLAVRSGDRVVELAAGPGSLGATWAELVGPTGSVLLSDFAPAMVDVARRRNSGLGNVAFDVLDASAIDRPDASFDVVANRMGLMFTPDPSVALGEIHRVLAPGGRIGAVTWAGPEHNPWMTCVGMAATMTGLIAGGPPTGPGGIFSLGDPDVLTSLVENAGFTDCAVEVIDITFRADDVESHIDRVSSLAGPLASVIRDASPEQLADMRRTASEIAAQYVTDGGLEVPGRALLVHAHT